MGLGEILDGSIRLYRQSWKLLIGTVAWVLIPIGIVVTLLDRGAAVQLQQVFSGGTAGGTVGVGVPPGSLLLLLVLPFLAGAVAIAAASVYLGRATTVGQVYRVLFQRFWALVAVVVMSYIVELIGLIFLIVPGVFLYVRLVAAPVVVVLEGAGAVAAWERSWHLTKGFGWKILGTVIVALLMVYVAMIIVQVPFAVLAHFSGGAGWVFLGVGDTLSRLLTTPFTTIVLVLIYFDLRIRKEAFDLTVLAQQIQGPYPG